MGKSNSTSPQQQMFNLDLQQRSREADMQNAQFIAVQMFERMRLEMESTGYLVQPARDAMGNWTGSFTPILGANGTPVPTVNAAVQAREIALRESDFEFTKFRFEQEFGLTYQDQQFRQAMESRQQQWTETYQRAQTALAEGDLTGYYNGQATLDREKYYSDASGYLANGSPTLARQQAEWNAVLNAPRGPADYHAYMQRMRGLNNTGNLPGVLQQFTSGQGNIASVTGDPTNSPMPTSNTQLAMGLVYGNGGQYYQGQNGLPMTSTPNTPATMMPGGDAGQAPAPALPPFQYQYNGGTTQAGAPSATPFPWQQAPAGGWTAPTAGPVLPGATLSNPKNYSSFRDAIFGEGIQAWGGLPLNGEITQADFDEWIRSRQQWGSEGPYDPRIQASVAGAKNQGWNTSVYDQWVAAVPNPNAPAPTPTPTPTPVVAPTPAPAPAPSYGPFSAMMAGNQPQATAQTASAPVTTNTSSQFSTGAYSGNPYGQTTPSYQPVAEQQSQQYTAPSGDSQQENYDATSRMFSTIFGDQSSSGPYGSEPLSTGTPGSQDAYSGARNWSKQQFDKLSPTEQQYTLGWNAEENGETMEDAQWIMDQGAPNYRQSRLAQMAGIG
jgi:hypothetical protein